MQTTEAVVAIMGMVVSFGLPLLLVAIILYYKHRKLRMTHATIAALAEKGLPVPPELLDPPRRSHTGLRGGLGLVALGIPLALFLQQVNVPGRVVCIPGLTGVPLRIPRPIHA